MEIPNILKNRGRKFEFIKEYPNYVLYEENKECFNKQDLGVLEEQERPRNSNPQRVKYF